METFGPYYVHYLPHCVCFFNRYELENDLPYIKMCYSFRHINPLV